MILTKKPIIQVDTREKQYDYIVADIENEGYIYLRSKLPFGDYMNYDNPRVVVERKSSICELCTCVGTDRIRFCNELRNAKNLGIHIILLVEDNQGRTSIEDLKTWLNPYRYRNPRAVSGESLYKHLLSLQDIFCFDIEFTSKAACGRRIVQLLKTAS